jgi:peptidyl-prolyl cis-trans isomerase SurA
MKRLWLVCWLVLASQISTPAQLGASHGSNRAPKPPNVATQPVGKPVVRVNGAVLTDRDLLREEYTIFPYARQHGGKIPKAMEPEIRDGAMQMIIFEELLYQEALHRKMTVPSARLKRAQAEFRNQFASDKEYQQFLAAEVQGSEQVLREKIRRSLLIDTMLKAQVDNKSAVSPAEVRAYYDLNPTRFQYPESFAIQTISFMAPEKATPQQLQEARKRAEAALPQTKATKSYEEFGLLAEKISEDDYRVVMGDHRAVARSNIAPQILEALLNMQPGQLTGILQVGRIYTIVRLNKHIPAGKLKFEDVKDRLKNELQKKRLNEVRAALYKKLRQNAKVEVL